MRGPATALKLVDDNLILLSSGLSVLDLYDRRFIKAVPVLSMAEHRSSYLPDLPLEVYGSSLVAAGACSCCTTSSELNPTTAGSDGYIRIYDFLNRKPVSTFRETTSLGTARYEEPIRAMVFDRQKPDLYFASGPILHCTRSPRSCM